MRWPHVIQVVAGKHELHEGLASPEPPRGSERALPKGPQGPQMGISEKKGTPNIPSNTRLLIVGTSKRVPPFFGNPQMVLMNSGGTKARACPHHVPYRLGRCVTEDAVVCLSRHYKEAPKSSPTRHSIIFPKHRGGRARFTHFKEVDSATPMQTSTPPSSPSLSLVCAPPTARLRLSEGLCWDPRLLWATEISWIFTWSLANARSLFFPGAAPEHPELQSRAGLVPQQLPQRLGTLLRNCLGFRV